MSHNLPTTPFQGATSSFQGSQASWLGTPSTSQETPSSTQETPSSSQGTSTLSQQASNDSLSLSDEDMTWRIPTVVGSMGRRREPADSTAHTYEWIVYVKSFYDEDLSKLVRRVEFELHPIFRRPKHIVATPPFMVKDTAFGQFDMQITIHFKHLTQKPIQVLHTVKLFGAPFLTSAEQMCDDKWLHSKQVIQVVYSNPSPSLRRLLEEFSEFDEDLGAKIEKNQREQQKVKMAIKKLNAEIMGKNSRKPHKPHGRKPY